MGYMLNNRAYHQQLQITCYLTKDITKYMYHANIYSHHKCYLPEILRKVWPEDRLLCITTSVLRGLWT